MIVLSTAGGLSLEDVLDDEVSPFPPALFKANYVFRKAEKLQLAKAIEEYVTGQSDEHVTNDIPGTENYVLEGGSLICLPWTMAICMV